MQPQRRSSTIAGETLSVSITINKSNHRRAQTLQVDQGSCIFPKGSKYHYSRYLVAIGAPKVHTILVLGPFGFLTWLKAAIPATQKQAHCRFQRRGPRRSHLMSLAEPRIYMPPTRIESTVLLAVTTIRSSGPTNGLPTPKYPALDHGISTTTRNKNKQPDRTQKPSTLKYHTLLLPAKFHHGPPINRNR